MEINKKKIRVMLAGPQMVLWGLKELLLFAGPQFDIVASVDSLEQAREALTSAKPDAVVVDVQLPVDQDQLLAFGVECSAPVIFLSGRHASATWRTALTGGLRGLVCTDEAPGVLLQAIEAVAQGRVWIDRDDTPVECAGTGPDVAMAAALIHYMHGANRWGRH